MDTQTAKLLPSLDGVGRGFREDDSEVIGGRLRHPDF